MKIAFMSVVGHMDMQRELDEKVPFINGAFDSGWGFYGYVVSIADGIVKVSGLENAGYGEGIEIKVSSTQWIPGIILSLEAGTVSASIFYGENMVRPGQLARLTGPIFINVGDSVLGRVVDPLGNALDSLSDILNNIKYPMESIAPSIISRKSVNVPLTTGLKIVDSLVPIGHGQRELIIGDTKTGKTTIALDTILNQKDEDTICIYVAIGQKRSSVARIAKIFEDNKLLDNTIIVAATASDTATLQYIAPYTATAIGEYFMHQGLPVLIIYDDLSKHAVSYRQISLLLRRPPGREGYPGDVFFLHSRLLERSANLSVGGSITALPIIETIQGDVSAYIPTNVISITDGQIFLEAELFSKGIRPSISAGLSVSRVGSAAQSSTLKKISGTLKLELAQYREVEGFTKLGFTLDDATKQLIDRGSRLTKVLIQNKFSPVPIFQQILFLFAGLNGYLDGISIDLVSFFEQELTIFTRKSFFHLIFSRVLHKQLDEEVITFVIWYFTYYFIEFIEKFKEESIKPKG